jgi:copper chaperone
MLTLNIPNISCGHCARAITEAIEQIAPHAKVEVDIAARRVVIEGEVELARVQERLAAEGYPASVA